MSLSTKIKALREKPQHVRERMLLVSLCIIAPLIIIGGVLAYIYESSHTKTEDVINFKTIGGYFSGTMQDIKGAMPGSDASDQAATGPTAAQ